ncbi:MAG: LCP family protein, partial [Anaerolineae bacterium]|nr:LCP family protein [Anaerolineae bacterium]
MVVISMVLSLLLRVTRAPREVLPRAAAVQAVNTEESSGFGGSTDGLAEQVILSDGRSFERVPWNGTSRFSVLVMGLDRRPGQTGLAHRTDTMMLASIDPGTDSLGILSIPRDLYVEVPGIHHLQRVNTPLLIGELRQPGSGPLLAMQTVEYNLGMRVHDYLA